MSYHNDAPYIKHILDSINDIEESIKSLTKQQFKKNKDVKDATIRRLEVIGEAVKNISGKTKRKYSEIEWVKIAGTRDILIHKYFGVDADIVWNIVKKDLPDLKREVQIILKALETKAIRKSR